MDIEEPGLTLRRQNTITGCVTDVSTKYYIILFLQAAN